MRYEPIMQIAAVSVLYTLLEFLIPAGGIRRSAATALRLLAMLCVAGILMDWVR